MNPTIQPFLPPIWAKSLKLIPTEKIPLGIYPTPITLWEPGNKLKPLWEDKTIWIKHEELTGCDWTGNKVRKLEYLLCEAKKGDYDCVITMGGLQSNHCRATAVLSRSLGLDPYLILHSEEPPTSEQQLEGNILISRLVGSEIYFINTHKMLEENPLEILKQKLIQKGQRPYVIPVGGTNPMGVWGYISCADELLKQIEQYKLDIDEIVVACGSGSTVAGLGLAMKLSKSKIRVSGICVCNNSKYFYDLINKIFVELGVEERAEDIVNLVDGYKGIGYGKSTTEELNLLTQISKETGVILDPTYTLKAARGMLESPLFSGKKILFINTGGIFSLEAKRNLLSPHLSSIKPLL